MFKIILLAVLVSVVWSTTSATFIIDGNNGYRIISNSELDSFHEPLYQTHLAVNYEDDHHGIVFPHIPNQEVRYIHQSINSFRGVESSGFKVPENKGHTFKHSEAISQNQPSQHAYQNQPNQQTYQNPKFNQHQIEVKLVNENYNQHQRNSQQEYQSHKTDREAPSKGILNQGIFFRGDYSGHIGQTEADKRNTHSSQYSSIEANVQDLIQQKFINFGFQQSREHKPGNNDNTQRTYKINDQNINVESNKGDQEQKSNQQSPNPGTNYNSPNYGFQSNEKVYPVIYSEGQLEPTEYIKLHRGNVDTEGYTEIPASFESTGNIYNGELRIADDIRYHPGINSNHAIRLDHNSPILISSNFHGNLNDHDGILIGLRNEIGTIKSGLDDSSIYQFLENNGSQPTGNTYPNYPENNRDNSALTLEQKSVEAEQKSVSGQSSSYTNLGDNESEYKGIGGIDAPKYSDSGKTDLSLSVEQKSLEVPLKLSSGQSNSYGIVDGNEPSYKDPKYPVISDYQESNVKNSAFNLEQKSVEIGVKGSSKAPEYGSTGDTLKYPTTKSKDSVIDNQQKSVDIEFKSGDVQSDYKSLGGSGSEYPGIGSIDAPKYPGSKTDSSVTKVEQKSVESGNYHEVKSSLKVSEKETSGTFGSLPKEDSDYLKSGINDYSKDLNSKISGYQKPTYVHQAKLSGSRNQGFPTVSGISSNSFFSSGHSPSRDTSNYNNKRQSSFTYPSSGNNVRSRFTGNSYVGSSGNRPTQTSNYFGRGRPNSVGSSTNYPRPAPDSKPYRDTQSYQRPISYTSHSYFENTGSKPSVSGIHNSFSHQQPNYRGIGGSHAYSGSQSISSGPKYHESVSGGISAPRYSDSPDIYNSEKFVKVSREYPQAPFKPSGNVYSSPVKPKTDVRKPYTDSTIFYTPISSKIPDSTSDLLSASRSSNHSPATSVSYLKRENDDSSNSDSSHHANTAGSIVVPSGVDYSNGIGGIEYDGIGESSSVSPPEEKSKSYSAPQSSKVHITEQKPYSSEKPQSSGSKSEIGSSGEEYKGIGEVGYVPSKSQIVGGRYPIRRPVKTPPAGKTKTSQSGIKGQSEIKTEQKYLPITAVLSGSKDDSSDSKPVKKEYDSTKSASKDPEKIEQQELVYEAFLAGQGPQSQGRGSSGYGFNRSPAISSDSGRDLYGSKDNEHSPPMPYEFEFDVQDDEHGSEQYRREKMDDSGYLTGSYGFRDAEGLYREVEYEASKEGFKVNSIKTNEPGTDNQDPADVHIEVQKHN